MRRIYWGAPLVQETRLWCTNKDKTSVSGQRNGTAAEQWATFLIGVGCGKPLFHQMHKSGIFRHTLIDFNPHSTKYM